MSESIVYSINDLSILAKKAIPEGMRLARVIYKQTAEEKKAGKASKDSQGCFVPSLRWNEVVTQLSGNDTLQDAVLNMLEGYQDKIIRKVTDNGRSPIDADININAIVTFIEEEQEASGEGRLTKEKVEQWFDTSLSDRLTVAFAEKLGVAEEPTEEQAAKIAAAIKTYRDKLSALSGGKTSYNEETCKKLSDALKLADENDSLAVRFNKRLAKMVEEQQDTLMALD